MKNKITIISIATLLLVFANYFLMSGNTSKSPDLQAFATGEMAKFVFHESPQPLPDIPFQDPSGQNIHLSDFKGQVILVNFWATWCAPCRIEMPHLDQLQQKLGSKDFQVVLISLDRKGLDVAQGFLDEVKLENLNTYLDPRSKLARAIKINGLPVTLLIDQKGRELGRYTGPADWSSDDSLSFIKQSLDIL